MKKYLLGLSQMSVITGIPIIENKLGSLAIYPNPTSGKFTLSFNNDKKINGEIFIYNELGILAKKESLKNSSGSISINLENMAKGIYIVKFISAEGYTVNKVIVQ